MKTKCGKIKTSNYSGFDWDAFSNNAWNAVTNIFGRSGKITPTSETTPTTEKPVVEKTEDNTMKWIIGGAAFVLVLLVVLIAVKK